MREKRKKAERLRLIILSAVGLFLVISSYFFGVYRPVELELRSIHQERLETQDAILSLETRVAQLKRMAQELDAMDLNRVSRMESYNNSKHELALLNGILADAENYSISFQNVTRSGDQVRRSFMLNFTADSYASAMGIIQRLQESRYRCLIGSLAYSSDSGDSGEVTAVRMSVDATFFETMVGGVPDAGLPSDSSAEG